MFYTIDRSIFRDFPGFERGVVVGQNLNNSHHVPELERLLTEEARRTLGRGTAADDPMLEVWDAAYRIFGANPKRETPSIRFLLSQIAKGRPPRPINPIVNAFNIISLRYRIPCGGDDLDALNGGSIELRLASGDEHFAPLFKPEASEKPNRGEVIYSSTDGKVMCRRWNWRNAHFSRITPETTAVAINLDCFIPPFSRTDLEQATYALARMISQFCGGRVHTYLLNSDSPRISI